MVIITEIKRPIIREMNLDDFESLKKSPVYRTFTM